MSHSRRFRAALLPSLATAAGATLLPAQSKDAPQAQPPASQPQASQPQAPRPDTSPVVAVGSKIHWNVPYVANAAPQQVLDLYVPAAAKDAPVVAFVHGGEWLKGDKAEVSFKPKFLNEQGIVLASLNYRLSGVAKHPAQVEDVAAAVRWLRDHVAEHGGDPRQIVLLGHSAGAHLVTLVALDSRPLAKVGMTPADLKGVASWSGSAFDLVEKRKEGGDMARYIEQAFGADEAVLRDASPRTHAATARALPRFLLASAGQARSPAAREAAEDLAARIRAAGGAAETVVLEGKSHFASSHELGMPNGGEQLGAILLGFVRPAGSAGTPVDATGRRK